MNSQVTPPLAGSFRLGVFDTSVLTSDIVSALGRGEPSSILAGMQHGTLRGFIPHYVWAEVPRVLADRRREGGAFDFRAAEALWWREYIPLLHVVPTTGLPMTPAADKIAHEDLSDIGAAQLTGLIGPVVLFAEDRDLVRHGIAAQDWRKVRAGLGKLGGAESKVRVNITLTLHAGSGVAQLARLARVHPIAAVVAAAAVGIGAHRVRGRLKPETRAAWAEAGKTLATAFGMPFVEHEKHEAAWKEVEHGAPGVDLLSQVARTLARSSEPLPRTAILRRLPSPPAEPHQRQMDGLGRLLRRFPAFHQTEPGRWQLGRSNVQVSRPAGL
ncbi:PIN domain-containing protein [Streptomyces sp. NPDC127166]|uniref:PIN domain-containing protein n=1 Tax=Streptomyces sp. NPDC127166 TaxID=3345380 RepID=UPI0036300405